MTVLELIVLFRKTFGRYKEMTGGCYKFHLILRNIYPNANGYYNGEHVITMIDGQFYDIDGIAKFKDNYYLIGGTHYSYEEMDKRFKEYL